MKVAYIMRGIPGSGKTTFANTLGCRVYSADDFHIDENGEYRFDPMRAAEAHQWCLTNYLQGIERGENVCVANTAIHYWEYEAYYISARMSGYFVEIHEWYANTLEEVKLCYERNTHGVPLEVVLRMWYEFKLHLEKSHVHKRIPHRIKGHA